MSPVSPVNPVRLAHLWVDFRVILSVSIEHLSVSWCILVHIMWLKVDSDQTLAWLVPSELNVRRIRLGWMVILGHRSSKSTFSADKTNDNVFSAHFIITIIILIILARWKNGERWAVSRLQRQGGRTWGVLVVTTWSSDPFSTNRLHSLCKIWELPVTVPYNIVVLLIKLL